MAPKTTYDIPVMMTKYHGNFDLNSLLSKTKKWLEDANLDFDEPKYKHKMTDTGAEIELEWECTRKVNYYVKEYVNVYMKLWDVKDVEVTVDGKKTAIQNGRVLIDVKGKVELDWQKRFGGSAFLQELQDILHKYILNKTIGGKWVDRLYEKVYNFNRYIRKLLETGSPG